MAGYTAKNLKEIENQGVKFGLDESDIELRMAKDPLECSACGLSYLRLGPGYRPPFGHTHKTQEEIYILVNGSARMKLDDELVEMTPLTAVRVSPETMRGYEAGPAGAELIVIGTPRTGGGDADTVAGWWAD
ncbi:MAG: cupin domain-containing protein [Actinobacteria bacterium]|jgi:mannose-6-phosphate isomerase-like protein (cupin superfamily)|nr:MAG: cupin domain-containing protein [Actinomycetota bacterium]